MKKISIRRGFTLVEIMIVVVIIGLLAAIAIPAFQKVRESSRTSALVNDARQIASGAQQYFLEYSEVSITIEYDEETGAISGDLEDYVGQIGRGYSIAPTINMDTSWGMRHPQASPSDGELGDEFIFNAEGQLISAELANHVSAPALGGE